MPATVVVQDTVAVPEPVIVPGVIMPQPSPNGTVSARATTPVKPLAAVIVIVDEEDCPVFTATGEEAAMVKSTKLNVAVAEWTREPLAPVTVRTYVPATLALQETLAVPDPLTVPGVIVPQVRPAGGVSVRETTPAKAFNADTVIVEFVD